LKWCFERQGVAILRLLAPGNAGEALATAEAFEGLRAEEGGFMAPKDFLGGLQGCGWVPAIASDPSRARGARRPDC
jgi:hypothetical protein